jgi:hypothetical protein
MSYQGISTETLQSSLAIYYERLTKTVVGNIADWDASEAKKQKYLIRIDEINDELKKRETIETLQKANRLLVEMLKGE